MLNYAKAQLRKYKWNSSIDSIQTLENLIEQGKNIPNKKKTKLQIHILLASAYAEIAHNYGHLLAFLQNEKINNITSIKKELMQKFKAIIDNADLKDSEKRIAIADIIYEEHKKFLIISRDELQNINEKQKEYHIINARIKEVKGYGIYRYAEWMPSTQDNDFKEKCKSAIELMQKALEYHQKNYALLQNIGMIYLNRRYDPEGKYLKNATEYFELSKYLKPQDYYSYQQLAIIKLRQSIKALHIGNDNLKSLINEGLSYIKDSLARRPSSLTLQFYYLNLLLMKLEIANEKDWLTSLKEIEEQFRILENRWPDDDPRLKWAQIFWLNKTAKNANRKAKKNIFYRLKESNNYIIKKSSLTKDYLWKSNEIYKEAIKLKLQLDTISGNFERKLEISLEAAIV